MGPFLWGPGKSVPLVCAWEGGLARVYHLCVRGGGLARVYHLCVRGGVGKSEPLVCVGGSQVHTTASLQQWTGGQFRSCRFHDVLPQVLGSPCTTVTPVPWFPLYHGSPVPRLTRHWVT